MDRRGFLIATTAATTLSGFGLPTNPALAVGPVKVDLEVQDYYAKICPPDKPIPGEKAMVGMRGMCVTVNAVMMEKIPKAIDQVGVYGFVTDGDTGDSVLGASCLFGVAGGAGWLFCD